MYTPRVSRAVDVERREARRADEPHSADGALDHDLPKTRVRVSTRVTVSKAVFFFFFFFFPPSAKDAAKGAKPGGANAPTAAQSSSSSPARAACVSIGDVGRNERHRP